MRVICIIVVWLLEPPCGETYVGKRKRKRKKKGERMAESPQICSLAEEKMLIGHSMLVVLMLIILLIPIIIIIANKHTEMVWLHAYLLKVERRHLALIVQHHTILALCRHRCLMNVFSSSSVRLAQRVPLQLMTAVGGAVYISWNVI